MPEETYIVSAGDSIPSIAKDKGFFWKTLWNYGGNSELKQNRKNPNVLNPGDEVKIPELTPKTETRGADARHKFRRKGEPVKIAIKFYKSDDTPRSNEAYVLTIDGKETKGNTDGDGVLKAAVPNDASEGTISFKDGAEVYPIHIGGLDPVDEVKGAQQRLSNLGFDCGDSGELDDATGRALENFQSQYKLDATGKLDDATRKKLLELSQ